MNVSFKVFILMFFVSHFNVLDAKEVGNGGGAIVCSSSLGEIFRTILFDRWEAANSNLPEFFKNYISENDAKMIDDNYVKLLALLQSISNEKSDLYNDIITKFTENMIFFEFFTNSPFTGSSYVPEVNQADLGVVLKVTNSNTACEGWVDYPKNDNPTILESAFVVLGNYHTVINYRNDLDIFFNSEIFIAFDYLDKKGIQIHESLYKAFRDVFFHVNSAYGRTFTALFQLYLIGKVSDEEFKIKFYDLVEEMVLIANIVQ